MSVAQGEPLVSAVGPGTGVRTAGTVGFGTHGGASRLDGQTWTAYRAGNTIHTVAVAPNGAVWLDAAHLAGEMLAH